MATVGLTLGKYAPLHLGHQYVIETALREMDKVVVIIYESTEVTAIPLSVRAAWIRKLYPSVEVLEAKDGPSEVGDTEAIKKAHEHYILRLLKGMAVTHFYSSEFYGKHMSKALCAVNRVVDEERSNFQISASAIRQNVFLNKAFLSPTVYKDLITNVVFLGAPSTGKTTIARTLAGGYNTVWMPEYGREYWEKHQVDRRLTTAQLLQIAEGHLEQEETWLTDANHFLFTDTNAITTCMFSLYYHGTALPLLYQLAAKAEKRYDLTFLCDTDIPYDDSWDRSGDVSRQLFQQQIRNDLEHRNVPFILLSGSLNERVAKVKAVLNVFEKWS